VSVLSVSDGKCGTFANSTSAATPRSMEFSINEAVYD
jgi:hypothetical protein